MTAIAAFYRHVSIEAFKVNWKNKIIIGKINYSRKNASSWKTVPICHPGGNFLMEALPLKVKIWSFKPAKNTMLN